MLKMMEKYANNLEELVAEKTKQLVDEKKKTDRLLYRMLPGWVSMSTGYLQIFPKHKKDKTFLCVYYPILAKQSIIAINWKLSRFLYCMNEHNWIS